MSESEAVDMVDTNPRPQAMWHNYPLQPAISDSRADEPGFTFPSVTPTSTMKGVGAIWSSSFRSQPTYVLGPAVNTVTLVPPSSASRQTVTQFVTVSQGAAEPTPKAVDSSKFATTTTLTVPSISAPPTIFSSISVAPQASSSSPRLDTTPTSTKGPSMSVMPFPAKQNQRGLIAGASIGAITLAVLIGLGAFLLYRSFKRRRASIEDEEDGFEKGDEAKGCPAMDIPNMNPPSDKAAKVLGMSINPTRSKEDLPMIRQFSLARKPLPPHAQLCPAAQESLAMAMEHSNALNEETQSVHGNDSSPPWTIRLVSDDSDDSSSSEFSIITMENADPFDDDKCFIQDDSDSSNTVVGWEPSVLKTLTEEVEATRPPEFYNTV